MKWKGLEKAHSYWCKRTCEISSVLCVHEEWEWMSAWILHSPSLHQSSQIHIVNTHLHHSLPGIGAFPHVPTTFLLFQGLGRLTTQKRQKTCYSFVISAAILSLNFRRKFWKWSLMKTPLESKCIRQCAKSNAGLAIQVDLDLYKGLTYKTPPYSFGVTSSIATAIKWSKV